MVPRDAPDRLLRTAVQYCARCDMNHQFTVGLDLLIRGLEAECPRRSLNLPRPRSPQPTRRRKRLLQRASRDMPARKCLPVTRPRLYTPGRGET